MMGNGVYGRSNHSTQFDWDNFKCRESGEGLERMFHRGVDAYVLAHCSNDSSINKGNLHEHPDHYNRLKERMTTVFSNDKGQLSRGAENVKKFTDIITAQENSRDLGLSKGLLDMIIIGKQLARFEQNIESARALVKARPGAEETAKDAIIASLQRDNKNLRQEQRSQNKQWHTSNPRQTVAQMSQPYDPRQTVAQMSLPYDQEEYNEAPFSHHTVALVAPYPTTGGRGAGYSGGRGAGTSNRLPAKEEEKDKGGLWTTPGRGARDGGRGGGKGGGSVSFNAVPPPAGKGFANSGPVHVRTCAPPSLNLGNPSGDN